MAIRIDTDQCMGCGVCVRHCPKGILAIGDTVNARGQRHVVLTDPDACIECGRCATMCTAAALSLPAGDAAHQLIDAVKIPPHTGCPLGHLTRALARAFTNLGVEDRAVLFKMRAADLNMHVRSHDYEDDSYFADALAYKREHPEDLVIAVCSSPKEEPTHVNEARYRTLAGEKITVVNTLNWFEADKDLTRVTRGGSRILEELASAGDASYLARGSIRTVADMNRFTGYIEQALRHQMAGDAFGIVELVYPCFYRVAGRPQTLMGADAIERIYRWFDECVRPEYPDGVLRDTLVSE